jgi:glycosyltransferase involved in cell wall biosynthesis
MSALETRTRKTSTLAVGLDLRPLADRHLRGVARYTRGIANALAARPGLAVTGFTDLNLSHEVPIPVVRYSGNREVFREQWALPRVLAHNGIEVFLCPTNRGLPLAAPCPTVLTLHDAVEWDRTLFDQGRGRSRARFLYASICSLASASLIMTVSQSAADSITRRLAIPQQRIRVVYEAPDTHFGPTASPDDSAIRQSLGLPRHYVLYLGGFEAKKDVSTLVQAFAQIAEQVDADLVLAGRLDRHAEEIVEAVQRYGISGRTHLPGYVPDEALPAVYRGARCFVFPGLEEGFGLPVVEAMACGIPVAAAASGSLPEVVGDGGRLVKPGDARALGKALRELLAIEARREESARAVARAGAFSWEQTAEHTEIVLREAAAYRLPRTAARRVLRIPVALSRCLRS